MSDLEATVGDGGDAAVDLVRASAHPSSFIEVNDLPRGGTFSDTGQSISDTAIGSETNRSS